MKEITAYQTSDGEIHTSLEKATERENDITMGKFNLELVNFIKSELGEATPDNYIDYLKYNIKKIEKVVNFRKELGVKYNINI